MKDRKGRSMGIGNKVRSVFKFLNHINSRIKKIDGPYELMIPHASYAPWKCDSEFKEVYNKIKNNTLVDELQCYGLWSLVEESSKTEGSLIEVGVWRGGTGALIAKRAELLGIKSTVYLCDTFCGVVKATEKDNQYVGGEHSDTSIDIVRNLVNNILKLKNVEILKGIFPEDSFHNIKEEKISFVHIDVDVYKSAKDIMDAIWERINLGGIIAFDDYGFRECEGITLYVNEQKKYKDRIVIHNLNGHGIIIKIR